MTSGAQGPQEGPGPDFDWSWAEDEAEAQWNPPEIDTTKPSPARMYDYALGGKDNFEVDRLAVAHVATVIPEFRAVAVANREFLVKAVKFITESGVDQLIDLGTGIPTSPNVHEVAQGVSPSARIVYVDNDPIVMAHNRARRIANPRVVTTPHDLREPATVLQDPQVRGLVNLDEPVGILFIAVLHFVGKELAPDVIARYREVMAPGSYLAISAACRDGMDEASVRHIEAVYEGASSAIVFRTKAEIEELFEGFDLVSPGLTDVTAWRGEARPLSIRMQAGVGRKV